jgi:hypothetical protein
MLGATRSTQARNATRAHAADPLSNPQQGTAPRLETQPCPCFGACAEDTRGGGGGGGGGGHGAAAAEATHAQWAFLGPIFCICLAGRAGDDAERDIAAREFCRVGLCRRVEFYRPIRETDRPAGAAVTVDGRPLEKSRLGHRGCWESHRAVAMEALRRGAPHVTVFEQDVEFTRAALDPASLARRFARAQRDPLWATFMLGSLPRVSSPTDTRGLVIHRSVIFAHALVYSATYAQWLKSHPYDTTPDPSVLPSGLRAFTGVRPLSQATKPRQCDMYLTSVGTCYGVLPPAAHQRVRRRGGPVSEVQKNRAAVASAGAANLCAFVVRVVMPYASITIGCALAALGLYSVVKNGVRVGRWVKGAHSRPRERREERASQNAEGLSKKVARPFSVGM